MNQEYTIRVQCNDAASGETGSYIAEKTTKAAMSPVFPSLAELFPWMRANGWKQDEYVNGSFLPWRVVRV